RHGPGIPFLLRSLPGASRGGHGAGDATRAVRGHVARSQDRTGSYGDSGYGADVTEYLSDLACFERGVRDAGFRLKVQQHFLDAILGGNTVEFAQDFRLPVLHEGVRPADPLHGSVDAFAVQRLDDGAAETVVQHMVFQRAN